MITLLTGFIIGATVVVGAITVGMIALPAIDRFCDLIAATFRC